MQYEEGLHRWNDAMKDRAESCGFKPRLCRPYRARTKGKVERFNAYLKGSFVVPLAATLEASGLRLEVDVANESFPHPLAVYDELLTEFAFPAESAPDLDWKTRGAASGFLNPWTECSSRSRPTTRSRADLTAGRFSFSFFRAVRPL